MAVNGSASKDSVDREEVPAEDDVDDVDDLDTRPPHRTFSAPKRRRRRLPIIAIGCVVIALVAGAVVVVYRITRPPKTSITFTDKKDGFRLTYPATWTVTKDTGAAVVLHVSFGAATLDTLVVKAVPLAVSVNTKNEATIKTFTDGAIGSAKITVLQQLAVKVNGLLGYDYLYTLPPTDGVTLLHSQFFIFPPHEMVILLFQTLEPDFAANAKSIGKVIDSVQAVPTS